MLEMRSSTLCNYIEPLLAFASITPRQAKRYTTAAIIRQKLKYAQPLVAPSGGTSPHFALRALAQPDDHALGTASWYCQKCYLATNSFISNVSIHALAVLED